MTGRNGFNRSVTPMKAAADPKGWLAGYIPDLPTPFDDSGQLDLTATGRCRESRGRTRNRGDRRGGAWRSEQGSQRIAPLARPMTFGS